MTKQQKREYIQKQGSHCPYCQSDDIEGGSVEIAGYGASQEVDCNKCDSQWFDIYKLVDIEEA